MSKYIIPQWPPFYILNSFPHRICTERRTHEGIPYSLYFFNSRWLLLFLISFDFYYLCDCARTLWSAWYYTAFIVKYFHSRTYSIMTLLLASIFELSRSGNFFFLNILFLEAIRSQLSIISLIRFYLHLNIHFDCRRIMQSHCVL